MLFSITFVAWWLAIEDKLKIWQVESRYCPASLRSKHFHSSYSAKVRAGAKKKNKQKKKMEEGAGGGGGEEKRKRFPANPAILENAPWYFTVRFICKLTARQDR